MSRPHETAEGEKMLIGTEGSKGSEDGKTEAEALCLC